MQSVRQTILALAFASPTIAFAYNGQELAAQAKVSIEQARNVALAAVPGAIASEELEHERGGSGLRYSFDIRRSGRLHEVGVDARTGAVLENKIEGPHPD